MLSPEVCPLGDDLQKYWDKRHLYFSKFDDGILVDAEGLYSVVPEETAFAQGQLISGTRVVDAFGGVGGSAIGLARCGKSVISIEKDKVRHEMSRSNAEIYGVSQQIKFINGDFFVIADRLRADTVNLDPPWGGPEYKRLGKFTLEHFLPDGNELLKFSLSKFNEVVLRVPTIFDFSELDRFNRTWSVHDDVCDKNIISKTVIFR